MASSVIAIFDATGHDYGLQSSFVNTSFPTRVIERSVLEQHFDERERYIFICNSKRGLREIQFQWAKIVNQRREYDSTSTIVAALVIEQQALYEIFELAAQMARLFALPIFLLDPSTTTLMSILSKLTVETRNSSTSSWTSLWRPFTSGVQRLKAWAFHGGSNEEIRCSHVEARQRGEVKIGLADVRPPPKAYITSPEVPPTWHM